MRFWSSYSTEQSFTLPGMYKTSSILENNNKDIDLVRKSHESFNYITKQKHATNIPPMNCQKVFWMNSQRYSSCKEAQGCSQGSRKHRRAVQRLTGDWWLDAAWGVLRHRLPEDIRVCVKKHLMIGIKYIKIRSSPLHAGCQSQVCTEGHIISNN